METMERAILNSEVRNIDLKERTAEFVISSARKDRHGTSLNMKNWNLDNYRANPIVGYQHDVYGGGMCPGSPTDEAKKVIGYAPDVWIEENGKRLFNGQEIRDANEEDLKLVSKIKFESVKETDNDLAEMLLKKVNFGSIRSTSVGFVPLKDEKGKTGEERDDGVFKYHGQELLEFSLVNIPSNPDAIKKELRTQTYSALMFIKKELGDSYSFSDIEAMKVGDILSILEKGKIDDNNNSNTKESDNISTTGDFIFKVDLKESAEKEKKELEDEESDRCIREKYEYKLKLNKNQITLK